MGVPWDHWRITDDCHRFDWQRAQGAIGIYNKVQAIASRYLVDTPTEDRRWAVARQIGGSELSFSFSTKGVHAKRACSSVAGSAHV
jgi:hypothetical protein